MKTFLIIIGLIIAYWVIGVLVVSLMCTLEVYFDSDEFTRRDGTIDESAFAIFSLFWPVCIIILICFLLWKIVKFIGFKISTIPVAIVAYIKGRNKKND